MGTDAIQARSVLARCGCRLKTKIKFPFAVRLLFGSLRKFGQTHGEVKPPFLVRHKFGLIRRASLRINHDFIMKDYKPNEFHLWCANQVAHLVAPIRDGHYTVNHRHVFEHTFFFESFVEQLSVDSLSHLKSVCRCGLCKVDFVDHSIVFRNNYNDFMDYEF